MIETIRASWGFTGLDPVHLVDENPFGNVIVGASDGSYWRICPEELSCEPIASSASELDQLRSSAEFDEDWRMGRLVAIAEAKLGTPSADRCFCLKVPAVLGGAYAQHNFGTITRKELLSASGETAEQIKDLPDGAKVRIRVV